jgi:hypothetical protein
LRYNPIARNFYSIRRVLIETLGLPRRAIRPGSKFADLVPPEHRKRVWQQLYKNNLSVEPLFPSCGVVAFVFLQLAVWIVLGWYFWPGGIVVIGPIAIVVGACTWFLLKRKWIEVDGSYTLGEAALRMTTPEHCSDAAYRLTRNEIFLKIQMVLVEALNVERDEVTPEAKLDELIGE